VLVALLVVLIVLPIVEIAAIVAVGQQIGAIPTVLLLLATAVIGSLLLRREGGKAWRAFRAALAERRQPAAEVVDGVLVLLGGLMMVLPGFVTDVFGFLVVLPLTRRPLRTLALLQLSRRLGPGVVGPIPVRARRGRPRAGADRHAPRTGDAADGGPVLEGVVIDEPRGPASAP